MRWDIPGSQDNVYLICVHNTRWKKQKTLKALSAVNFCVRLWILSYNFFFFIQLEPQKMFYQFFQLLNQKYKSEYYALLTELS